MRLSSITLGQWVVISLIALVVILLWLPSLPTVAWVGRDILIEFIVTDAVTHKSIVGATIRIVAEGGLCRDKEWKEFTLVSDDAGRAERLVEGCMSYGKSGWNVDTYAVHLPEWRYEVSVPGYARSDLAFLDVPENYRRVQRGRPARLTVPIALARSAPGVMLSRPIGDACFVPAWHRRDSMVDER